MATTVREADSLPRPLYAVRALRHRQFRHLWLAQGATTMGQWMDQFTRGWLVYTLTGSAAHLALVSASRAIPLLFFGLWAGVLADRMSRRRLLMASQSLNVVLNLILAALIVSGSVEVWHIYLTGFLAGIGMAVQQPARQSIIPTVVPREDLQNAVVLNSGTLNIGQAVGPALGGLLIAGVGMGSTYFVQAGLFVAACLFTFSMEDSLQHVKQRTKDESMLQSLRAGIAYVRTNEVVLMLLMLALVPMFFGNPYQSLVPLFAADILDLGEERTGLLMAATGIGSVISLVVLAAMPPFQHQGRFLVVAATLYGIAIMLFASARVFWVAAAVLLLAGFTRSSYRAINHSTLLTETEDAYRGRVNSLYLMDRGLVPLGTVLLGLMAELLGPSMAMLIMGGLCALGAASAALFSKRLWRI
jgi:MFS family permease